MKSGDTFLMPAPGISIRTPHLWIVITDPSDADWTVIVVSITTLKAGTDQTVILQQGEHPFINRPSSVFYGDARLIDARDLDGKVKANHIQPHSQCPPQTLENVRAGVLASEFTPQKVQRFYEEVHQRKK